MEYISSYSPDVEQFSVDECFVDFTGTSYLYKDLIATAYKIKDEIYEKFGFTVNIGIGNNKLCAKWQVILKNQTVYTHFLIMKLRRKCFLYLLKICLWLVKNSSKA